MDDEHEIIDLSDDLIKATVTIDDGRDCTAWIIWNMRTRLRIRSGIFEAEPARPQVAPFTITPKKKPSKKRRYQVAEEF